MNSITDYRLKVLDKYGVKVNYGKKVDMALIKSVMPDALIIATGSLPIVPRIAGLESGKVYTGDEALREGAVREKNIAVIGGGLIGCEVAEYLAERGKNVTIFEMKDDIAQELTCSRRVFLLERLKDKNVKTVTDAQVTKIDGGSISVIKNGEQKTYEGFEAVISAPGRKSDTNLTALEDDIKALGIKVYTIGDACKPSFALEAIYDGFCAAADIVKLQ
jgi:pyruvate/2-oxoglutarate dehydrogenase complex dihydrolipoamide dehydrogenase (E3) component